MFTKKSIILTDINKLQEYIQSKVTRKVTIKSLNKDIVKDLILEINYKTLSLEKVTNEINKVFDYRLDGVIGKEEIIGKYIRSQVTLNFKTIKDFLEKEICVEIGDFDFIENSSKIILYIKEN